MILTIFNFIFLITSLGIIYYLKLKKVSLSKQILLSLSVGLALGFLLKYSDTPPYLINILTFISDGYLALLKMLVIPLILTSIIHAILNLGSGKGNIKKLSFVTCFMLLGMTAFASLITIIVGMAFSVGEGLQLPDVIATPTHTYSGIVATLLGMLPSNPIAIMAKENTIAVVLFAALLGISARMLDIKDHDKMETFKNFIAALFAIVKKLTQIILNLTPYGILALISLLILNQGTTILTGILNFIIAMYVAMFLVLSMHSIILLCFGYNPFKFFKLASLPLFVAFTTRSSFGTLPVTEETLSDKFKMSQVVASFVPSIGTTIGMNACAGIFPAMLVVMTMTIMHEPITMTFILMVMFINAIASLGISGIPGTAYIAATVSLTSLQLPYSVIALVQGIDPIIDMGRTATNVSGVMTTALVVDRLLHTKTQRLKSDAIALSGVDT